MLFSWQGEVEGSRNGSISFLPQILQIFTDVFKPYTIGHVYLRNQLE